MKSEPAWTCPRCAHNNPDGYYMCASCELSREDAFAAATDPARKDLVWRCPHCPGQYENLASDEACTECGRPRAGAPLYPNPAVLEYLPGGKQAPLIACPACAREVSRTARACPHCGHRVNPDNAGELLKVLALFLVVVVCLYVLCSR